jgi:hypothetical protein
MRRIDMPYKNKADRKYVQAAKYEDTPEQIKNREARNKARAKLMKTGKVSKGDGQDIDHIKPLSKGGSYSANNLRVKPRSENRSFSRNSDHTVKRNTPQK